MKEVTAKENKERWLHDVPANLISLILFLTKENKGKRVYELMNFINRAESKIIHVMSNGLSYSTDKDNKWYVLKDTLNRSN